MNMQPRRDMPDITPPQPLDEFGAETRQIIGSALFSGEHEEPRAEPLDPSWWEQPAQLKLIEAKPFVWRDPKTFPRRQWLYGRHLIRKFLSCTIAPGGVGKTNLVLVEAVAMASGRPLLGMPVRGGPHRVWVINLEDPLEELERRVVAICIHFGIDPSEIEGRLLLNSGRDTNVVVATTTKGGTQIAEPVVAALRAEIIGKAIDVVMIDPLVKAHRVPENDNGAIDAVCTVFADIADEADCAFDLVHHVRKSNGAEVTVEDSRGASALMSASRSMRTLNRMTKEEAEKAGVDDLRSYFRADDGKANLAPLERAQWFRLASVSLGNGEDGPFDNSDHVGVAESWTWPDALDGVTVADLLAAQQAVAKGRWRENVQATDWVGIPIAEALKLVLTDKADKAKVARLLKTWTANGMFVVVTGDDEKRRPRSFVEVGEWAVN